MRPAVQAAPSWGGTILPARGGPGLLPPPARAAAAPALAKGEACTPLLAALVGTPPSSSRAAGSHPPCPGCRQQLARAGGSSPGLGLPPPFVPGATRGAAGLVRQHTEYGAGVLQTHSWGQGGQRNPGDRGAGWGAAVSGRQQSRQKNIPIQSWLSSWGKTRCAQPAWTQSWLPAALPAA